MSLLDIKHAKEALAWRLKEWGVTENYIQLAASFIDDLTAKGWQIAPQREDRPHPPTRSDECKRHAGQRGEWCGLCAVEDIPAYNDPTPGPRVADPIKAARDAAAAAKYVPSDEESADV